MLHLITLALVLLLFFQNKKIKRLIGNNDAFMDHLVRNCDNFYVRDSDSDIEIFKLEMNNRQYHSLAEFLQSFKNGGTLQRALDSRLEYGEFFLTGPNKDSLVVAVLHKVGHDKRVVLFLNLQESMKDIGNLEKENKLLEQKLEFFQALLDNSPFLLYAKNKSHEIYNKEYLAWKEMITFPSKSCTFGVDMGARSLSIEAKVNKSMFALFGQDNVSFAKSSDTLTLYEKRIEILLKNTSEKVAILDRNMQRVACSRSFLKDEILLKEISKRTSELKHLIAPKTIKLDLDGCVINMEVIPYLKETILIFR